jgi:hypothetical protein
MLPFAPCAAKFRLEPIEALDAFAANVRTLGRGQKLEKMAAKRNRLP